MWVVLKTRMLALAPDSIVILGAPRSGTTWLAKIFDSHPQVTYLHEPDTVIRHASLPRVYRDSEIPRYFAELRNQSNARVLLRDPNKAEDLATSVERDLTPPEPSAHPAAHAPGPKGN